MAPVMLNVPGAALIMWKLSFGKTRLAQKRMKSLEDRLDAAVAESRRLRTEMDALQERNELRDLRKRLRKQSSLTGTDTWYPDDDTVH